MDAVLFSEISLNNDGCCLVRHEDTVYKVKVIFGQEVRKCDSMEFHLELEQVFRAVLCLARSDKPIPPIFTNHLMVKPLKKDWAICHKIGFRQNNKDLQTSQYYFQFHVSERPVWKTTQDKVLSGKKPNFTRNQETTDKKTREKLTRNMEREEAEIPETEPDDRETNRRQPVNKNTKNREWEKQQSSSRQLHNVAGYQCRQKDNKELQSREVEKRNFYARAQDNEDTVSKSKNQTASSDSEDDQQKSRRSLRRSARIGEISSEEIGSTRHRSTRRRVERSAVTELSQSGINDLDITCDTETVPTNQDKWRRKRSINPNVDDITGFSYKVNKFRSKILGRDNQSGKSNRHVLYRAGGCGRGTERPPLIMELPEVTPSDGTESPNKTKQKRPTDTGKTRTQDPTNSLTARCGGLTAPIPSKPINDVHDVTETIQSSTGQQQTKIISRKSRDGSCDSHQSSTSSTESQSLKDGLRQSTGHRSLRRSSLKVQRSSVSPKGHRARTRSSESPNGRKTASPAKDVKILTRSSASSKGPKSQVRSVTPSKGHRGRWRSATPSLAHRRRLRSATPLSPGDAKWSATTSLARRGRRMRSATPTTDHRLGLRSATSSKAQSDNLRLATQSTSLRRRTRTITPSVESERLLNMTHPVEHGIQVNDVDRYLVQQEELQEMSKLQKMASTQDKQTGYQTRSQKRSGLWNFVDSMIITPAKKMLKRI